jgi:hypothetical protein
MLPAGFEPTIPVKERPQTQALDRTATRIGLVQIKSTCDTPELVRDRKWRPTNCRKKVSLTENWLGNRKRDERIG